ncbi:MAG: YbjQ family protein [Candidatus Brocadiales bacterium]|nr:YbjQ family protein [Candidatus Brocadiales bacterium]
MIVTTSMFVAGREIEREIDVITSECVFGMNIFRDMFAAVRDVVGGRSKASEKVLADAKKEAMNGLKEKAAKIGADAVIAIDLDYMEMGGGKSDMLVSIASGTAVKLKQVVADATE